MTRSRTLIALVGFFALAGLGPTFAAAPDTPDGLDSGELSTPVEAPFNLAIRNRTWNGDPHAMSAGRAVLDAADQMVWELADVATATASADGSTVALLTRDFHVFVSRLPETPRPVDGGRYLSPALSSDGTFLVAQRLGQGGHILEKTFNTQGIALVNLATGEDRLLLEGNDLYSPSFASDETVFFGSGGREGIASLYVLDLGSMSVARVTNREDGALQAFPSEAPRLMGGMVVYRADGELFRVPAPGQNDFAPAPRFESPRIAIVEDPFQPDGGSVTVRTPTTKTNNPKIYQYFDQDGQQGGIQDYACFTKTYDQHRGTDFNQPYGYDVAAPASGEVVDRYDGCANNNSWGCGIGYGNHVAIRHSDGTVSLEAHGKKGTVVPFGTYSCGTKLMESASSGNSNAFHIHHESRVGWQNRYRTEKFDPFEGSCDPGDPTKWSTQNDYGDLPGTTCTN